LAARGTAGAQAQPEPAVRPTQIPDQSVKPVRCKDLPELRLALIGSLRRDRGILASGIEKSLPWEWAAADSSGGGKLLIPVRDSLTAGLLEKEYPLIRQILGELWDTPLELEVIVSPDSTGDAGKEPELPPQVALVQRMFRGTVVKISSKE
jgi:DNA polymerase-3 subunit gamma/tau